MATTSQTPPAPPRRRTRRMLLWLALAVTATIAWFWQPIHGRAVAGASYGAHAACTCRHVSGRSLADCRKDFLPGMGMVTLSEDTQARSVTARVPLLASQTAAYRAGEGCVLEPWAD